MRLRFFGNQVFRIHDEAPAGIRTFSQPELRGPSGAAKIKTAQEILDDRPAYQQFLTPNNPPEPRVEGKTSEMLVRSDGGAREFRGSAAEVIPQELSIAQILERNRNLWAQGIAPAMADKAEHDVLRAMNRRMRDFWGAR